MKRGFLFFSLFFLTFLNNPAVYAQSKTESGYHISTVVIDAGHGGKDGGATYSNVKEKDIVLLIAKALGKRINEAYPEIRVIYTRDKDVFIELHKRAEIANKNRADLFISIHCNAAKSVSACGTETFVMGLQKSEKNLEVAKAENASILYEADYEDHYGGYDPNIAENNIIFSLYQNAYLDQSLIFSSKLQDNFTSVNETNRGVKQAPFLVLWRTTMPSVLIEAGFISNVDDRKFLNSAQGQDKISEAIFKAFKAYKTEMEDKNKEIDNHGSSDNNSGKSATGVNSDSSNKESSKISGTGENASTVSSPITYKVQFLTSSSKLSSSSSKFTKLKDVSFYIQKGVYKYTAGEFSSEEGANEYKQEVKKLGYKDAFVVKFENGERGNK